MPNVRLPSGGLSRGFVGEGRAGLRPSARPSIRSGTLALHLADRGRELGSCLALDACAVTRLSSPRAPASSPSAPGSCAPDLAQPGTAAARPRSTGALAEATRNSGSAGSVGCVAARPAGQPVPPPPGEARCGLPRGGRLGTPAVVRGERRPAARPARRVDTTATARLVRAVPLADRRGGGVAHPRARCWCASRGAAWLTSSPAWSPIGRGGSTG